MQSVGNDAHFPTQRREKISPDVYMRHWLPALDVWMWRRVWSFPDVFCPSAIEASGERKSRCCVVSALGMDPTMQFYRHPSWCVHVCLDIFCRRLLESTLTHASIRRTPISCSDYGINPSIILLCVCSDVFVMHLHSLLINLNLILVPTLAYSFVIHQVSRLSFIWYC